MDIGDKIYSLRKKHNMTLEELGEKVGVSKSTIHKWETGQIENMRRDKIPILASALNTTVEYLMGWDSKREDHVIHILGRVAAGYPTTEYETDLGTIELSEDMYRSGDYFALEVHGDSMSPNILDGDVVIVRVQPDAESGEVVVATIDGEDATCKRLRKYRDGIALIPNNPAYPTFEFTEREIEEKPVTIIGKVVELRRRNNF